MNFTDVPPSSKIFNADKRRGLFTFHMKVCCSRRSKKIYAFSTSNSTIIVTSYPTEYVSYCKATSIGLSLDFGPTCFWEDRRTIGFLYFLVSPVHSLFTHGHHSPSLFESTGFGFRFPAWDIYGRMVATHITITKLDSRISS